MDDVLLVGLERLLLLINWHSRDDLARAIPQRAHFTLLVDWRGLVVEPINLQLSILNVEL